MPAIKTTPTELGYVSGSSSNIQTQISGITSGGGQGQVLTTSSTVSSDLAVSSTTYIDSGLSVTFTTTKNNEVVLVSYLASCQVTTGTDGTAYTAYKLDAGSDIPIHFITVGAHLAGGAIGGCFPVVISTAGSHTIKIRIKVDSGRTFTFYGTNTAVNDFRADVVQF